MAFITNRNKPSVKTVIGKVKISKIGLTVKFSNPRTIATKTAVKKLATETPGRKYEINITNSAVITIRRSKFILVVF